MSLRKFTLTREQQVDIYIDCDDADIDEAKAGAWELANDEGWDDEWTETLVVDADTSYGKRVWVGAGDGDWGDPR